MTLHLLSTLVLTLYIDVVLSLSITQSKNYCRNNGDKLGTMAQWFHKAWCYIADPAVSNRWAYCSIPICE